MTRPRRVLAMGWFGAGNLGDEAMLEGLRRWLTRALGPVDMTVTSSHPEETVNAHDVRVIRLRPPEESGFGDWRLVRAAWRADLVTLGGGDLIREQADGIVPARNWLARMRVPFRLGRATALVGVSTGDLNTPAVIDAIGHEVRRFGFIAARDSASAATLAGLANRPVPVMGDLALEAIRPAPPVEPHAVPRIAVTTREIVGRGQSVPDNAGEQLNAALAGALDRVVDETGAQVELVPLRRRVAGRRRDDDERAGELLAAGARTGRAWLRRAAPTDADAFTTIAASVDVFVAVRLHGVVLGAGAGRRVVGVAYDPKVSGFLQDLGVPDQAVPLAADAERISAVILRTLADRSLGDRIAAGVGRLRARTQSLDAALRSLVDGSDRR